MMEVSKVNWLTRFEVSGLKLGLTTNVLIVISPIIAFMLFTAGLALPTSRSWTIKLMAENNLVEMLTFVVLLGGGIYGIYLCQQTRRRIRQYACSCFYFVFSLGLLFTAMEEVAWGQQFWAFETPMPLQEINMQGETTIHNIRGLHGRTEFFRLAFGFGGLIGICLAFSDRFRIISPSFVLLTWFLVITAHAAVDVLNDFIPIQKEFDALVNKMAELVELLIAGAGFLYLWLNAKEPLINE